MIPQTTANVFPATAARCLPATYHLKPTLSTAQESGEWTTFVRKLRVDVARKPREIAKLTIPALLYTVQNNMLYTALANLDAATYSVCYQTKILTTALFSMILLSKRLSLTKWAALILLTVGVALAELSGLSTKRVASASIGAEEHVQSPFLGFMCVMAAACTSGFAGVYFEMLLKGSKTSLWIRNIQMGIPSILISLFSVVVKDWSNVRTKGFLFGYNWTVVGVVLLQAIGGLVVAVVVKYADNIRKSFATAVSIIISCIMSTFLFDFHPNGVFVLGVMCVCASVFIYSRPPADKGLPSFHKVRSTTRRI